MQTDSENFTNSQRSKFCVVSIIVFILQAIIQISMGQSLKATFDESIISAAPAVIGLCISLSIATLNAKYDYQLSWPYGILFGIANIIVVGYSVGICGAFFTYLCFAVYATGLYFIQMFIFEEHTTKSVHYAVAIGYFILTIIFGILFFAIETVMCAISIILLIICFITRKTPVHLIIILFK